MCLSALRRGRPFIIDNAIPTHLITQASQELTTQSQLFQSSGQSSLLRTDSILWLNESTAADRGLHNTSKLIQIFKKDISTTLTRLGKSDDNDDDNIYAKTCILPRNCMISYYDGKQEAFYTAHRDGTVPVTVADVLQCVYDVCTTTVNRGFLAGLQTLNFSLDRFRSEKNFRIYTAILYLNVSPSSDSCDEVDGNVVEEWSISRDGGALRCFVGADASDSTGDTATEVIEVAPVGGRMVLFQSRELLHAVQPTRRTRLALTAWIFSNEILGDDEISGSCVDVKVGLNLPADSSSKS